MPVSESPWWWSPDDVPGGTTVRPIHSAFAPVVDAEMAADRRMPLVCAVSPDSSAGRISRSVPLTVASLGVRAAGGRRWPSPAPRGLRAFRRLQGERDRVDAPALVRGNVVTFALEHVAEVGVTPCAPDLGADHAVRAVLDEHHGIVAGWAVEGRPAAVRLELLSRTEQLGPARPAAVDALGLRVRVLACPWRLGARLAEHRVLLRREHLAPLRVRPDDLLHAPEVTCGLR